ncbi:MAG TPA: DUF2723 domain-containing protein, partial [Flavobacteriales bacterium]|nr:DUF2723 domain-containing protein [Flavobacteriales bacterium]
MNYKNLNNIIGWIIFAIALCVYTATMEDTVSLWDCGEYISTAYKLEVGHPPGAPLFNMLGRIFSAFVSTHNVAWSINFMSGLVSAFTILFLFWSITHLAKKMALTKGANVNDLGTVIAILGSGAIGAIAYTFSDSFWFSAVEGEVYAMSSFFTAAVVWAIFRWEEIADEVNADRWIILIFFLIGLSIGVHLLNLLAIPAMAYAYYFRKCRQSVGGFIFAGIFGMMILAIVQATIIPGIPERMANFELLFTNTLGMPFGVGTGIFITLVVGTIAFSLFAIKKEEKVLHNLAYIVLTFLFGLLAGGIIWACVFLVVYLIVSLFTQNTFVRFIVTNLGVLLGWIMWEIFFKKEADQESFNQRMRKGVQVGILSFTTLIIGYSCFLMILIRSNANTPIDENNPENPISFLSYLQREQYGSWPILYGPYWNSAIDVSNPDGYTIDGNPIYMRGFSVKRDDNLIQGFRTEKEAKDYVARKKLTGVEIEQEYFVADDRVGIDYKFNPDHMTLFPRMFSREDRHVHGYKAYSGYDPNNGGESFTDPLTGKTEVLPTFGNNLTFFFNYQVGWMYWRYFMWNFAGRQNDEQGIGPGPLEGNWISGINFIDKQHVGDQSKVPPSITRNRAYNKFFMLPLILGLIGFVFHFFYARGDWFVILLLFLFTGMMIIIYLNPKPYEPRERDYAYAGSFYAFAFWIGLGVWALYDMAKRVTFKQLGLVAGITGGLTLVLLAIDSGSGQGFTFSFSMLYILIVSMVLCGIMLLMGRNNSGSATIATVAILLSAPVPYLMGSQGWNDHDRSNRTTAL